MIYSKSGPKNDFCMQGRLNETCVRLKTICGSCTVMKKNQNRAGVLLAMSKDFSLEMLWHGWQWNSCYSCYFSNIISSVMLMFVLGLLLIVKWLMTRKLSWWHCHKTTKVHPTWKIFCPRNQLLTIARPNNVFCSSQKSTAPLHLGIVPSFMLLLSYGTRCHYQSEPVAVSPLLENNWKHFFLGKLLIYD